MEIVGIFLGVVLVLFGMVGYLTYFQAPIDEDGIEFIQAGRRLFARLCLVLAVCGVLVIGMSLIAVAS